MTYKIIRAHQSFIDGFYDTFCQVVSDQHQEKSKYFEIQTKPTPEGVANLLNVTLERMGSVLFLLADEKVVGWALFVPQEGSPLTADLQMGILKEYRGRGNGKKLLQTALQDLKNKAFKKAELCVFSSNQPAINLYQSVGFKVERIQKGSYDFYGKQIDSILMGLEF